jgi:hypothetical protein
MKSSNVFKTGRRVWVQAISVLLKEDIMEDSVGRDLLCFWFAGKWK